MAAALSLLGGCDVRPTDTAKADAEAHMQGLGGALVHAVDAATPDESDEVERKPPVREPPSHVPPPPNNECEHTETEQVAACAAGTHTSCVLDPVPDDEGGICWKTSCHDGQLRACRGSMMNGSCVPFEGSCLYYKRPQ